MKSFLFRLVDGTDPDWVEAELYKMGVENIYLIEDDATGELLMGGNGKKAPTLPGVILVEEKRLKAVDWEEQWKLFAPDFKEGKAKINLQEFGANATLSLTPGAGFGDLSHPTTYLMLKMMQSKIQNESILDIGCGSGILSLAALLMGAKAAIGVDIDQEAIEHAKENNRINGLRAEFFKTIPKQNPPSILLMNMIFPEQKELQPQKYNKIAKLWIVSGVLEIQEKEYLSQTEKWGWKFLSKLKEGQWLGFIFSCRDQYRANF